MTTLTNEQVVAELKWTELAIKNIIGVSPHLFRPVKCFFFCYENVQITHLFHIALW
jgi:hypothetical protein